jgi:ParB-like chromosome segregation protein Spo0J
MNSDSDRVNEYSKLNIDTPIYAFKPRKTNEWYVSDGGHRVTAALQRGDKTIPAIVPLKDFKILLVSHY